jgi:hypothetical protein
VFIRTNEFDTEESYTDLLGVTLYNGAGGSGEDIDEPEDDSDEQEDTVETPEEAVTRLKNALRAERKAHRETSKKVGKPAENADPANSDELNSIKKQYEDALSELSTYKAEAVKTKVEKAISKAGFSGTEKQMGRLLKSMDLTDLDDLEDQIEDMVEDFPQFFKPAEDDEEVVVKVRPGSADSGRKNPPKREKSSTDLIVADLIKGKR